MSTRRPMSAAPVPKFFATSAQFRKWLLKHHDTEAELWVGLYKKGTGKRSITWHEIVDQALCFGWIDGIRKSIDEQSYMNRVTPRRRGSTWSAINIRRAQELIDAGLMLPAGEQAFKTRNPAKANLYSFEQKQVALEAMQEKKFRANKAAWKFFQAQPPSYRKPATWWVVSAKQQTTKDRRLATLIADSAAGLRIKQLRK